MMSGRKVNNGEVKNRRYAGKGVMGGIMGWDLSVFDMIT